MASKRAIGLGLGLGPGLLILVLLVPSPGMSPEAWAVTGVLLLMATWWVSEAVPAAVTALVPLVLLPPLGVASLPSTAAPHADPLGLCSASRCSAAISTGGWRWPSWRTRAGAMVSLVALGVLLLATRLLVPAVLG